MPPRILYQNIYFSIYKYRPDVPSLNVDSVPPRDKSPELGSATQSRQVLDARHERMTYATASAVWFSLRRRYTTLKRGDSKLE